MNNKQTIVNMLELNQGNNLSGQQIADQLGISRAAVWKIVRQLKSDGYLITAKTNGGYVLEGDCINAQAIDSLCNVKPAKIVVEQVLDSTNTYVLNQNATNCPNGTLVIAKSQTAGKGRIGRTFASPYGGIYISIGLRPMCDMSYVTLLTPIAAVATAQAIRQLCNLDVKIKWVNDLYLNNKKICGILTQAVTDCENAKVNALAVGIGINFDTSMSAFEQQLQDKVGCLFPNGNDSQITKNMLIAKIYDNFMLSCQALLGDNADQQKLMDIMAQYRKLSLVIGKTITFERNGQTTEAIVNDIDNLGRLIVRMHNGQQLTIDCGEISIFCDNGWM